MTNRALFDIESDGENRGYTATHGVTLTISLRNPTGVGGWQVQVYDPDGYDPTIPITGNPPKASKNSSAMDLTGTTVGRLVRAAHPTSNVTVTTPSSGSHSYIVRSIVDGGFTNGKIDPEKVYERILAVIGTSGLRKPVVTESLQFEDDSWAGAISDMIDTIDDAGIGGSVASSADLAVDAIALVNTPLTGLYTLNGVVLEAGMVVLAAAQTGGVTSGPYIASGSAWARLPAWGAGEEIPTGSRIFVSQGTFAGGVATLATVGVVTIGTTTLAFNWEPYNDVTGKTGVPVVTAGAVEIALLPVGHMSPTGGTAGQVPTVAGDGKSVGYADPSGLANVYDGTETAFALASGKKLIFGAGSRVYTDNDGNQHITRAEAAVATEYPHNARSSTATTTTTTTVSVAAITLASNPILSGTTREWRKRDGVFIPGAGAAHSMTTPAAPVVTLKTWSGGAATTGSVQLEYQIVAVSETLGLTLPSAITTISNAPTYFTVNYGSTTTARADMLVTTAQTMGNRSRFHDNRRAGDQGTSHNNWLYTAQAAPAENGLYDASVVDDATVNVSVRASDSNTAAKNALGKRIRISLGDVGAGLIYRVNLAPTTLGTDPISIVEEVFAEVTPYILDANFTTTANIASLAALSTTSTAVDRATAGGTALITLVDGHTILVKDQTDTSKNGLYVCGSTGAGLTVLTRVTTYDQTAEMLQGTVIRVKNGLKFVRSATYWVQYSAAPATVDTDPVTFRQENKLWYAVYRRVNGSGSLVFVGAMNAEPYWISVNTPSNVRFMDWGRGPITAPDSLPTNPPSAARNNALRARLATVSNTSATLDTVPGASVTGATVYHDNYLAFESMHALTIDAYANTDDAVGQYWPPGTYNFMGGRGLWFRKSVQLNGFGRSTVFRLRAGADLRVFGANTRDNPDGTNAPYSEIRHIVCSAQDGLPAGGRYISEDSKWHGAIVYINSRSEIESCQISGGTGSGFVHDGRDTIGSNVSQSWIAKCTVNSIRGHGYTWGGSDTNGCIDLMNQALTCHGNAFYDSPFLNSTHIAPLAEGNLGRAGYWDSFASQVISPYTEGGHVETYMADGTVIHGGLNGTPVNLTTGLMIQNRTFVTPLNIVGFNQGGVRRSNISLGARNGAEGWRYSNKFADATSGLNPWSMLIQADSAGNVQIRDPLSVSINELSLRRVVNISSQAAAITSTNLYSANPASGTYLVTARLQCTVAQAGAAINLKLTADGRGGLETFTGTTLAMTASDTSQSEVTTLWTDGAHNITYEVEATGVAITTGRFALNLSITKVGP